MTCDQSDLAGKRHLPRLDGVANRMLSIHFMKVQALFVLSLVEDFIAEQM